MPKLTCLCGFIHDLSPIPDGGWVTIRDVDYEKVVDSHILCHEICGHGVPKDNNPRINEWDNAMRLVGTLSGRIYECPDCGRIAWQKPGEDNYRFFLKDSAT